MSAESRPATEGIGRDDGKRMLLDRIAQDEEVLVGFLSALVRAKSPNPPALERQDRERTAPSSADREIEPGASRQKAPEPEPPAKGKVRESNLGLWFEVDSAGCGAFRHSFMGASRRAMDSRLRFEWTLPVPAPYLMREPSRDRCGMATVENAGERRWIVHLGSPDESRVSVEVNMSAETAKRIAERETERIAALNPGRDDLDAQSVGSAVMSVLGLYAAGGKP